MKQQNKIIVKSPTRVDLAGGTLDMWPLYNFVSGASTINLAIDIWTEVELTPQSDPSITIESKDLKQQWQFADLAALKMALDPKILFYQKVIEKFELPSGFSISTASQSPIGGGLGGSSSLVISMIKAFHQWLGTTNLSPHQVVHLAHNIEAEILKTPTGTQDYYPAITGGLSFIDYTAREIRQQVLPIKGTPFEDHFLLVYTGRSHHSGLNNFEVLKSAVEGDLKVLSALKKIKEISEQLKTAILQKNWSMLPSLFRQEYEARLELTPAFTSPEIEKLAKMTIAAGALAVKICGAGGGGCVLVWVSPQNREKVVQVCQNEKFQCLNALPVEL
ncbi:MAG: galactokinase [Bdellovibrionales bacterium RIFCSPHIGHO2_01_FULL_40_29]|nr:MAG: galactokinase [Bdellovibrionales bacterium RIFCSPHIGHO2_01_FULL_40_29]OFZ33365.1 MAG: galactokinase [Bdellovibrionales bacterium RIFCSPHIGHO2_02_FULL_40_15]